MNSFIVNMPKKIHFNVELPVICKELLSEYGNILLLLPFESMENNHVIISVVDTLSADGKKLIVKKVASELGINALNRLSEELSYEAVDAVLAVGGGSVLDAAKIISAQYTNGGSAEEILNGEISFTKKSLPLYIAPSTHASAEANSIVSVCSEPLRTFKKEIQNRAFIADEILIDPRLCEGGSRTASLNSMMISFVNLIEGYVSKRANPFCDALITNIFADYEKSIYDICANGIDNEQTRATAAYASVVASVTKEHCGRGIVSSLANAVCSVYKIPYGAVCGALMYPATLKSMQKVQMFAPASVTTEKFSRLGALCSGMDYEFDKHHVLLRSLNNNLSDLRDDLKLPALCALGVERESFYNIVSKVLPSETPVDFAESELIDILEAAF